MPNVGYHTLHEPFALIDFLQEAAEWDKWRVAASMALKDPASLSTKRCSLFLRFNPEST
jgi:hypothetical protein